MESTEGRGAIAWRELDGLLQEHDYEEHDYEEQHYDDEDGWSSGMENPCTWVHGGLAVELITTTVEVLDQTGALLGRLSDDEVADVMYVGHVMWQQQATRGDPVAAAEERLFKYFAVYK